MAENIAQRSTTDLVDPKPRIVIPYRSPFNRVVRLLGMVTLLGSTLGLLAAVAGFPLNWGSMLAALALSIVLIGYSIRPSLRRPKF
ncbi:MAG: hypothetical protein PVSMB9_04550 [Candidatus Dormibacteria bacterium]